MELIAAVAQGVNQRLTLQSQEEHVRLQALVKQRYALVHLLSKDLIAFKKRLSPPVWRFDRVDYFHAQIHRGERA